MSVLSNAKLCTSTISGVSDRAIGRNCESDLVHSYVVISVDLLLRPDSNVYTYAHGMSAQQSRIVKVHPKETAR